MDDLDLEVKVTDDVKVKSPFFKKQPHGHPIVIPES